MTESGRGTVDCERFHARVSVRDLRASIDHYTEKLGFSLGFTWQDPPTFAGVNFGEAQLFLSPGEPAPGACSLHFVVDDADALFAYHVAQGAEVVVPPGDREYGLRDYAVRDLDGYDLVFGHYILTEGPPVEIERVDVPVRLERRLAALVRDLAEHKGLSVDGCLEEILLHTCEPYGDGVASPHTKADLRHIQRLKEKHGIDYDTHASYRFVERTDGA